MKSPSVCGILFLCLGTGLALLACEGAQAQQGPGEQFPQLGPETFVSIQSLALGENETVYAGSFGRGVLRARMGARPGWRSTRG